MLVSHRKRRLEANARRLRRCGFELLEVRALLSVGTIELGPSDNIALDQPRVAIELLEDQGAAASGTEGVADLLSELVQLLVDLRGDVLELLLGIVDQVPDVHLRADGHPVPQSIGPGSEDVGLRDSAAKQREERAGVPIGCGVDGVPNGGWRA